MSDLERITVNLDLRHLGFIKHLLEAEIKRLEKESEGGNSVYKLIPQEVLEALAKEVEMEWAEFIKHEFAASPEAVGNSSLEAFKITR